jgi:hypothetical protein
MILIVPVEKDIIFSQNVFSIISENISDLAIEHEKLPNKIIFTGTLGHEVFSFIKEKEWNFKNFNLEKVDGLVDSIIFKYATPLTQTEGKYSTIFDGGSLHGKEINGIPGPETIGKIMTSYSSPAYTIERTVRPEKKILLKRS